MLIIAAADAPRHHTPNASMRTLAAPSLGATELSVWEVLMRAGQRGPEHRADREQVWTVLHGELEVQVEGEASALRPGDALCLPPDVSRQVTAATDSRVVVASPAGPTVTAEGGVTRPLPWAA